MASPPGVAAVERALGLLICFEAAAESLTLAQLAQRSGLYKSTILRLATSLQRAGFLKRSETGRFSLGSELSRLGQLARATKKLESILRPELQRLTNATEETVSFYVRQGKNRICLFREVSPQSVRHYLLEGGRHTLFLGATGRIFKAYGTSTPDREDAQILRRGWVASIGERKPELAAVAVPLLSAKGELLGVLNISVLLPRFTKMKQRQLRSLLLDSRERLQPQVAEMEINDIVQATRRGCYGRDAAR